jgi:hypothetical protein
LKRTISLISCNNCGGAPTRALLRAMSILACLPAVGSSPRPLKRRAYLRFAAATDNGDTPCYR